MKNRPLITLNRKPSAANDFRRETFGALLLRQKVSSEKKKPLRDRKTNISYRLESKTLLDL